MANAYRKPSVDDSIWIYGHLCLCLSRRTLLSCHSVSKDDRKPIYDHLR